MDIQNTKEVFYFHLKTSQKQVINDLQSSIPRLLSENVGENKKLGKKAETTFDMSSNKQNFYNVYIRVCMLSLFLQRFALR